MPAGNGSLALRLIGRTVNRDAVGSRVELQVGDRRLVGLRQAGSGFLSQSSAWLHFGVGSAANEVLYTIKFGVVVAEFRCCYPLAFVLRQYLQPPRC